MKEFEPLIGHWGTGAALGPSATLGHTTFEWLEGGGYVIQRATADDPALPSGVMVIGPTADGSRVVQHYFDSRGVARVYEISLEDGVWRLWREPAHDGDFAQRFTGRFRNDGRTIAGAWERRDGAEWVLDFELYYSREPG